MVLLVGKDNLRRSAGSIWCPGRGSTSRDAGGTTKRTDDRPAGLMERHNLAAGESCRSSTAVVENADADGGTPVAAEGLYPYRLGVLSGSRCLSVR